MFYGSLLTHCGIKAFLGRVAHWGLFGRISRPCEGGLPGPVKVSLATDVRRSLE